METLSAPFPWFGGKSRAAPLIWERFGDVRNYLEPFAGSPAVLLNRPHTPGIETLNDLDAFICNVWRALAADPPGVALACDRLAHEADLHAAHLHLRAQREVLSARCMADLEYFDARIAGLWLWGISQWIGGGWCGAGGAGPWGRVEGADGLPEFRHLGDAGRGVTRQRLHLGDAGCGVKRQLLHLGNAGRGVTRQLLHLGGAGQGVKRKLLHLGDALPAYFVALQARLRCARVCCGEWHRILGESVIGHDLPTGILLDPPYSTEEGRDMNLYAEESGTVAHDVRAWCLANGGQSGLRIALCGYGAIHDELLAHGWTVEAWKAQGGMGSLGNGRGRNNATRERIWFSPHCLRPTQGTLFD